MLTDGVFRWYDRIMSHLSYMEPISIAVGYDIVLIFEIMQKNNAGTEWIQPFFINLIRKAAFLIDLGSSVLCDSWLNFAIRSETFIYLKRNMTHNASK